LGTPTTPTEANFGEDVELFFETASAFAFCGFLWRTSSFDADPPEDRVFLLGVSPPMALVD